MGSFTSSPPFPFNVTLVSRLPVKAEAVALWQLCESTEHPQQRVSPSFPPTAFSSWEWYCSSSRLSEGPVGALVGVQ